MTDAAASRRRTDALFAWRVAGSFLVAVAFLRLVAANPPFTSVVTTIAADVVWCGALVIFAIGWRGAGSVVARQPLGVVALLLAGALPLLLSITGWLIPPTTDSVLLTVLAYVSMLLPAVALGTGLVVVARAGAVPAGTRWVPLIVFGVVVAFVVAAQILAVAGSSGDAYALLPLFLLQGFLSTAAIALIGILAIAQAPRAAGPLDAEVQVYPPPA